MKCLTLALLSGLAGLASAICFTDPNIAPRADGSSFGYDGLQGPLNWYSLAPENELCATGKFQSPIDVAPAADYITTVPGASLSFHVEDYPEGTEFENKGTTIEAHANGTLTRDGQTYDLVQFHFHTPSEHRIGGESYALEAHFVFVDEAGKPSVVVGVVIDVAHNGNGGNDEAEPSPFFEAVLSKAGEIPNGGDLTHTGPLLSAEIEGHVDASDIYQYPGSLTTPPCDEGIAWNVVAEPAYVSAETYEVAKSVIKFNSRYTQNAPGEVNLLQNAALKVPV